MMTIRFAILVISLLISVLQLPARALSAPFKLMVGYAALNARVCPLWIAEEQGFFTKYAIDPEPIYIRGAPTLVAGLSSGDIQVGRSGGSARAGKSSSARV